MKIFKYGDSIVILGIIIDGVRCDAPAKYIEEVMFGTKKGCHRLQFNTVDLRLEREKFMDAEEYFKSYNDDKEKLPEGAMKRLWFQEFIESENSRGNLLDKMIGDNKNEKNES